MFHADFRFFTRRPWAVLPLAACFAPPACGAQEASFRGTYSVADASGPLTLVVETLPSGEVRGWLEGTGRAFFDLEGRVIVDEEGDASVEGKLVGPTGGGEFELYHEDGQSYGFILVPHDTSGPRGDLTTLYTASKVSAEVPDRETTAGNTSPGPGPSTAPGASLDARLVGTWSTQVMMSSPAGTVATELRMRFEPDGTLVDLGTRSLGSVGGGIFDMGPEGAGERLAWQVRADILHLSPDRARWVPMARVEVTGDRLVLYHVEGSVQIWNRVQGG